MRKRFSRAIHVSLALLIVLALVVMPTPRSASAGDVGAVVDLVLLPSSQTVDIGEIFDITIEAQCNGQDIHGVDVFVDFDPNYLEVQSVTPGTTLSMVIQNIYDNAVGTIDYSAGTWTEPLPCDTFTVATISFKALGSTPNTDLTFYTELPRKTKVTYAGESKLRDLFGATVTITETLTGDVNGDGRVNVLDMIRIGMLWGETDPSPGWIPEDVYQDGVINVQDMILVGSNWTG